MEKQDIVIVGSGGLAREVKWIIESCNKVEDRWNLLGWVSKEQPGTIIDSLPVLGNDDWLLAQKKQLDVAIAVGDGFLRHKIVQYLQENEHLHYPAIIAPSAEMSDSVHIGKGSIVAAKCILTVDISLGQFCYVNLACTVGHDCVFEKFVTLHPGANISGDVHLGDYVTIGTGASIIQGVSVATGATVGAGATVIRDVAANLTVAGVPAKPLEDKHGQ